MRRCHRCRAIPLLLPYLTGFAAIRPGSLCLIVVVLTATSVGAVAEPVTLSLAGHDYRVNLLSTAPPLIRIERKGAEGFEDRPTFLVTNRSYQPQRWHRVTQNATQATFIIGKLNLTLEGFDAIQSVKTIERFSTDKALQVTLSQGDLVLFKESLDSVHPEPKLPTPAELSASEAPTIFALRDAPRFVAPVWGATPAPAGSPHPNTSGFDLGNDAADVYLFVAESGEHASLRRAVLDLTGNVPLLPEYAFGLWFTWYHYYTQDEKLAEIQRFVDDQIPLDVASLDMDWRALPEKTVGYEVNTTLFPNMTEFIEQVHALKKKVFFNDHPMMRGPHLSPAEVQFRYEGLTSMMRLGLDFWWFDCHWHDTMKPFSIPGDGSAIDYMAWGQYIFRSTQERWRREHNISDPNLTVSLGCSNSNHWANHRTPVWWTGDNYWTKLQQEVKNQIEYGLQLKPYVHMDCTGHHGPEDGGHDYPPEAYLRWVQFCAMGTIMRIHSDPRKKPGTNGARQPWIIGGQPATENIVRDFVNMRYRLIPTLVAAGARVTEGDGMPLVRRLDLEWPELPSASRDDQYLLGDDILVAPIDPFANNGSNESGWNRERTVWLPPSDGWIDAFSGEELLGNQTIALTNVSTVTMPIYQRKGGLVLLAQPGALSSAAQDKDVLVIEAYAPSRDGTVMRFAKRADGRTEDIKFSRSGQMLSLSVMPPASTWKVRVRLPRGEQLLFAKVDDTVVSPALLFPSARHEHQMPFGAPGSAAKGATIVELELRKGQRKVLLELSQLGTEADAITVV